MEIPTMPPGRYRKKPVEVEAAQIPPPYDIEARMKFEDWIEARRGDRVTKWSGAGLKIETLEGVMTGNVGDYVICGVQGELYPCKPDIFEMTHNFLKWT